MSCIQSSNICKPTIEPIPAVLNKKILSFLSPENLASSNCVNKSWKVLTNDKLLWKAFDLQHIIPKLTIINEQFWSTKRYEIQNTNAGKRSLVDNKFAPHTLPHEMTLLFLSYLEPMDLGKVEQLDGWSALCKHTIFASMKIDVSDIKPIDGADKRAMIPVLKKLSRLVERDAGMTLLTIPKGLSFNKLKNLTHLAKEHGSFRYVADFERVFGMVEVDKTYRVVITNNVLLGSRNLSVQDQEKLINKLEAGCKFPKVIEMVTLLITTFKYSNTLLFNDNPLTYSRCEEIIGDWQLFVGGFSASGRFEADVDDDDDDNLVHDGVAGFQVDDGYLALGHEGVAGRREFFPAIDT